MNRNLAPRRSIGTALVVLLLPLLAGCSSLYVSTDWDRSADFSSYKTFRWAPTKSGDDPGSAGGSLVDTRIRRAVADELIAKGFQRRDTGPADLLLVYKLNTHDRIDVYRHSRYWGPTRAYRSREGTLVLMIVDPVVDRVVWEGVGEGLGRATADELRAAVAKILADFPPGTPL